MQKATVKETWASMPPQQLPQTDHLHATPNWGSNIKAKGAPTKYWDIYSKWTYFPEGQQFTKNVFSIGLISILIVEIVNWWVLLNVSLNHHN